MPKPKPTVRTRLGVRYRRLFLLAGGRYAVWRVMCFGAPCVSGSNLEPHFAKVRVSTPEATRQAAALEATQRAEDRGRYYSASPDAIREVLWETDALPELYGRREAHEAISAALSLCRPLPKPDRVR